MVYENLGRGPATDLLSISLSPNDILGHQVGPDSPEMQQMALDLDHELADFITFLGHQIGLANVWIALSADHGVSTLPDAAKKLHIPAANLDSKKLEADLNAALAVKFSPGHPASGPANYVKLDYPMAWLNQEAFPARVHEHDAEAAVGEAMKQAGLRDYYTKSQLAEGEAPDTPLGRKYLNSYSPEGSWYVMAVPDIYTVGSSKGTDHASPYNYDTHVPLAFYGLPFQAGTYRERVEPVDLAATLASLLGINAPTHAVGRVLTEALAPASASRFAGHGIEGPFGPRRAQAMTPDLSVNVAGIPLKNPVIAASGTFGYGVEFEDIVHLDKLGGFVVKGLSREPMIGNPPPRLWETAAGMLNAIGLQNIGAPAFLTEKLPHLREIKNIVVLANVFGYTREDYERTIEILNEGEGIAAYELNVSCPNTAHGGLQFGSDPALAR